MVLELSGVEQESIERELQQLGAVGGNQQGTQRLTQGTLLRLEFGPARVICTSVGQK